MEQTRVKTSSTPYYLPSNPQTDLASSRTPDNPIFASMENSNRRHRSDLASKLGELVPISTINVDETVHVANAKAGDRRLGVLLPLGTKTGIRSVLENDGRNFAHRKHVEMFKGEKGGPGKGEGKGKRKIACQIGLHSHPAACLAIMPNDSVGLHVCIRNGMTRFP
jgi:hypothetical protein